MKGLTKLRLIVVTGSNGSGKTTITEKLLLIRLEKALAAEKFLAQSLP